MKETLCALLLLVAGFASAETQEEQASRILIAGYEAYGASCGFDKSAIPDDRSAALEYAERARPCVIAKIKSYFEKQQQLPSRSPSFLESLGAGFQGMGETARSGANAPIRQTDYACMQRCLQTGSVVPYCTALCSY